MILINNYCLLNVLVLATIFTFKKGYHFIFVRVGVVHFPFYFDSILFLDIHRKHIIQYGISMHKPTNVDDKMYTQRNARRARCL